MPKQNRWIDVTDPAGRELLGRAADLSARFLLLDHAEALYVGPGHTSENAAVATLMHACDYLRDRIGYEMEPHPKGMIQVYAEVAGKRLRVEASR
jgi:hypothetical protein